MILFESSTKRNASVNYKKYYHKISNYYNFGYNVTINIIGGFMIAEEARAFTKNNRKDLSSIYNRIKIAAISGKYFVFDGGIFEEQLSQLIADGYTVRRCDKPDMYCISWEEST